MAQVAAAARCAATYPRWCPTGWPGDPRSTAPHPDSAPGPGRMDPETGDPRLGRPPSRTWTISRSPDQSAVTRIRSSRPSPACRTLLLTSSETSNWASKASGSGNRSWRRARRALVGAVRVGRRRKSRRRWVSGAVCWWCLATETTSLPAFACEDEASLRRAWPISDRRILVVATCVTVARLSGLLCYTLHADGLLGASPGREADGRANRAAVITLRPEFL